MTPPDYRHLALGDVDSTNTECMQRARAGDAGDLWITADRQLGGRGRRGRQWISEPGNLYSSLLLVDPAPVAALASLPLAVAVAVHEAIRRSLPTDSVEPRLKWPNDVRVDGRKIAGILIESEQLANGRRAVVIGCGINVAHRPEAGLYPATCLKELGARCSPQELFARLYVTMTEALALWDRGRGIAAIRAGWLERAEGVGSAITVRLPDRDLHGLFDGIDAEGRLILLAPDGQKQCIAAGDVFFPAIDR
ncbi:biotin--[acetyl-CoA-carboxylase] ligase [Hoeflea marina]|uniref:biotin--[acetyl-CoA-carboxylase] ligase n=1 Tax=Hoeflea marina TaxID=274592 RepID=UPI001472938E|nr:biotin--[acetyl-CoA-carboxylase] ligase [Hoeflea marina]